MRDKLTFKQQSFIDPEEIINNLKYIVCHCLWFKQCKGALNRALYLLHKLKVEYQTAKLQRWIEKADKIVKWLFLPENIELWKREREIIPERSSPDYLKWRLAVLKRDNRTCQDCGEKKILVAHHIKRYKDYKELRLDVNNGRTLCRQCHWEAHKCLN